MVLPPSFSIPFHKSPIHFPYQMGYIMYDGGVTIQLLGYTKAGQRALRVASVLGHKRKEVNPSKQSEKVNNNNKY